MKELAIEAVVENLGTVMEFINETLSEKNCSMKTMMQLELVVEELFINIAHYAYEGNHRPATIRIELEDHPSAAVFTFMDSGVPYNPLERSDPDLAQKLEDREIGGLGIFLVKKNVDELRYEYRDGKNVLQFKKLLQ